MYIDFIFPRREHPLLEDSYGFDGFVVPYFANDCMAIISFAENFAGVRMWEIEPTVPEIRYIVERTYLLHFLKIGGFFMINHVLIPHLPQRPGTLKLLVALHII